MLRLIRPLVVKHVTLNWSLILASILINIAFGNCRACAIDHDRPLHSLFVTVDDLRPELDCCGTSILLRSATSLRRSAEDT